MHIFVRDFKYNSLFINLYHNVDIENMLKIRNRSIRLYGNHNECCVCLENTIVKTDCKHFLCQKCFSKLSEPKTCPMCRNVFESDAILMEYNFNG